MKRLFSFWSDAEAESGIPFRFINVDSDGKRTMRNIALPERYINKWDVTMDPIAADFNNDAKINIRDLSFLQRKPNGWNDWNLCNPPKAKRLLEGLLFW